MFRCRIGHPTVFLKRRILQEVGGFDTRFRIAMDYDLWQRLCAKGYKPTYFPRVITVFAREGLSSEVSPTLLQERREVSSRFRNNTFKHLMGTIYDFLKGR